MYIYTGYGHKTCQNKDIISANFLYLYCNDNRFYSVNRLNILVKNSLMFYEVDVLFIKCIIKLFRYNYDVLQIHINNILITTVP